MSAATVELPVKWRMDCPQCGRFLAATECWPGVVRVYCKACRVWVEPPPAPCQHPAGAPAGQTA